MPSNFVFILHFHQPHGQLKYINERIFENSYRMLLEVFKQFSDLKFTVHISGPLLIYLKNTHSDWLEEMLKLGDIGTIEFMAGTISEAVLPLVPSDLRLSHITRYIELFESLAGFKPKGFWLPERVWEPWLPEVLAKAGLEYVVIDDSTLRKTGFSHEKTKYAWITEESGYSVKVLFIDEKLRYILPWEHPDKVIDYMAQYASDADALLLWGSDAEKFGEWWDRDSSRRWLVEFLSKLRFEKRILMVHPSEYLREHDAKGYIYLDTGSYDKMLEWSGGFFRNFLVKYVESNNMHKKALWVKSKLVKAQGKLKEIPLDYYMAYCNDAYWHGLFGGIYLAHLRQAIYESLIRSEKIAEDAINYFESNSIKRILADFDYNGREELIIETPELNLYVSPWDGGTLFEYDIKKPGLEHNIQDTMTRYREPYLEGTSFNPDWYRRTSWRVHIWGIETSIHDWINNTPFKDMSDLALHRYNTVLTEDPRVFYLRTIGNVYYHGSKSASVFVEKRVELKNKGYSIHYVVRNLDDSIVKGKIGFEYHLAWKVDRDQERKPYYLVNGKTYSIDQWFSGEANTIILRSEVYPDIILRTDQSIGVWIATLSSYARTEKGLKTIPQGLAVMFVRDVELKRGEDFELEVEHTIDV
ncbi:MAG: alpha-amylase/4-alpha-glucanotransferase domain-containing protein [Desulfurococcaceae archaeon]